jgi:hypothetical protein
MKMRCAALALGLGWVVLSGCGTSTKLSSRPHGAEVIMDGERLLGRTPLLLQEQAWLWTDHTLTFRKEGYLTEQVTLEANANAANVIVCLCLWPLWPLSLQGVYQDRVVVNLEPSHSAALQRPDPLAPIAFQSD